jgi:hypothetical protein
MPFEPEPEVSAGSFEHTNAFWHNLTANSITGDYRDSKSFQTDALRSTEAWPVNDYCRCIIARLKAGALKVLFADLSVLFIDAIDISSGVGEKNHVFAVGFGNLLAGIGTHTDVPGNRGIPK